MRIASLVFSLIALAFSVLAFFGRCCFVDISNGALSLIAICCTLIVGVSVADAITVRRLERKMEELVRLEKKVKKLKNQSNVLFHHTWGIQNWKEQPYTALCELWKGFFIATETDDIKRAKSCLANMEKLSSEICEKLKSGESISKEDIEGLPREVPKSMKDKKVYCAFDVQINKLIEKINNELLKEQ